MGRGGAGMQVLGVWKGVVVGYADGHVAMW